MKILNRFNLPAAIVQAVTNDAYDPGDQVFLSASQFSTPPRLRVLSKLHRDELEEDVSSRLWALLGQAVHAILERSEPSALVEKRLYAKWGEYRLSGQFDRLTLERDGTLQDYKVTSVWSFLGDVKPEWETQLNVLRWLAIQNGYAVKRLQIVALLRDWVASKAKFESDYPDVGMKVQDVRVWSDQEAHERIGLIIERHVMAETTLPECTPDEMWQTPDKWAVKKGKNKRAVKLFDDFESAIEMASSSDELWVEHRPGARRRCEGYCPVASFCTQWQDAQAAA